MKRKIKLHTTTILKYAEVFNKKTPFRVSFLSLVGLDGLEPSTSALSEQRSNQLSYKPKVAFIHLYKMGFDLANIINAIFSHRRGPKAMVEIIGFEPMTPCLQGRCSSQLSYTPISNAFII